MQRQGDTPNQTVHAGGGEQQEKRKKDKFESEKRQTGGFT